MDLPLVIVCSMSVLLLVVAARPRVDRTARAAASGWTPVRVREAVAAAGVTWNGRSGQVAAVRALRRADHRLGLPEAVALVRAARQEAV